MTLGRDDRAKSTTPGPKPTQQDLKRIIDRGPVGFVITDSAGVVEWINETLLQWLGYESSQLVGHRTFQELLSPGGRIYYDTHVRPLVHMRRVAHEIALELVCVDQRRLSVLINASLEIDAITGEETIETFVIDATRRREYENELLSERQVAERSESRLQVMYDIVSGLADVETVDDIVRVVTEQASRSMRTTKCDVWILEPGDRGAARVGPISDAEAEHPVTFEFPDGGPALDLLAAGEVVVITDSRVSDHRYPLLSAWMSVTGLRSAAIAPLITDGRLHGAISYGYEEAHIFDEPEIRATLALAAHTEQGLRRVQVLDAERRNKRHLESLLEFTTVLSAALTLDEVIDAIVDRGQQLLGAAGSRLALLDDSGTAVRFVRSRGVSNQPEILLPLGRRSIGCAAIRTGQSVVVDSRHELKELFPESPILDHPSFGRVVSVPLRRGDEILGAWVLADGLSGPYDAVDVTVLELFAEQAGQATQRAAMHETEALARSQADTRNLISAALNRAITTSDVGRAITVQGQAAFAATTLAFFVIDPNDPTSLQLEAQSGLDEATTAAARTVFIDPQIETLFTGTLSPSFAVASSEFDDLLDRAIGTGRRGSAALIPLGSGKRPLGLIVLGFDRPDALSSSTRVALSGLAGESNVALARARRFDIGHDVATTLQRSLLPSIGPLGADWTMTTSYEPWSELLEVGGDLFDVTPFPDGRIVLVVGDVVGHGLEAAAAMGLLRSAAKMLTLVASSPAEVIEGLRAFANVTPAVLYSSVCCVEVQPDGTGRYSCAGHPFPVLRHVGGDTEVLDAGRSPLIGIGDEAPTNAAFTMPVGSSIVVYTDGLIERKGEVLDAGIEQLRLHLSGAGDSPGDVRADRIARAMLDGQQRDDDVVVVCLTRRPH